MATSKAGRHTYASLSALSITTATIDDDSQQAPTLSTSLEIHARNLMQAVTFSTDAKYLVSGDDNGVQLWLVDDGRRVATMEADSVRCVAISQDGGRIAAGTWFGHVHVWDTATSLEVLEHREDDSDILGVDFSPDSTRLVSASLNRTAAVWDLETRKRLCMLPHENWVIAARYSPQGDRIATAAACESIRLWDGDNGSLLLDIPVEVTLSLNRGLFWFNDHLFAASSEKIREIDASTGTIVSEQQIPGTDSYSCIALPRHGAFVAYSTNDNITFWDASNHSQLCKVQHPRQIRSISVSPDGQFLAIDGVKGTITIQSLSRIMDPIPLSRLHPTLKEPIIQIGPAALDAWKDARLEDAEVLLTAEIAASRIRNYHILACRALVRASMRKWDAALLDAEKAIKIRPSVIGYIAKSITHLGEGDRQKASRCCDIAVELFHSSHVTFLLLIKAVILFMAGEHMDAISRMDDLIATIPFIPVFYVVQAYMHLLRGTFLIESGSYDDAIESFKHAQTQLRPHVNRSLFLVSLISGWKFDDFDVTIRQRMCEALYKSGRAEQACYSVLELVHTIDEEAYIRGNIGDWISDFAQQYLSTPQNDGDAVMFRVKSMPLLREWAKTTLAGHTWRDALIAAVNFLTSRFAIYRVLCECLIETDRIMDATECSMTMASEMAGSTDGEQAAWIIDFQHRLCRKLEELGDVAMKARQHVEAAVRYSAALSFNPANPKTLFLRRSKAQANMGLWKDALDDANEAILLDPSSPLGYKRKFAALHVAGHYDDAEISFRTMLSKMSESPDPEIRERSRQYIKPAETEAAIREVVQSAICESPLVLINTDSGRLLDKPGQASSFEAQQVFHELVCSTTTHIDHLRIQDEVGQYYRYATFSHKWKAHEPQYEDAIHAVVYELEESPTHDKLQKFCKTMREAGLHWAWSDTVCINRSDPAVLQEALVSMFQWYQSSTLTVVLLCDAPWKRLVESIWNTRAWTFQEYHASKVVRFYNQDWMPYRGVDLPNHKESPEIIAEMEEATGISAKALMLLRPGLENIREKLRLASTRQSTRIEDVAYSLLGIFSLSMPVVYGEGDRALGKLLAQLLTSSGDTSILAWTGRSGSFNSCLPLKIAVFSQSPTSHIPPALASIEKETITSELRKTLSNVTSVIKLYERLNELPVPSFMERRMKLPCIVFKLGPLSVSKSGSEQVFRAQATTLGVVEVKTEDDLLRFKSLVLVYPWMDFLLDRQPAGSVVDTIPEEKLDDRFSFLDQLPSSPDPPNATRTAQTRTGLASRFGLSFLRRTATRPPGVAPPFPSPLSRSPSYAESLRPPSTVAEADKQMHAFRALARLRQPFGALLLTPDPGNVAAYNRVATESAITAQVEEITPAILDKLIGSVRVLDVL